MPAQILIINQHGENRGDEAALRAMLRGLQDELGEIEVSILVQVQDRQLGLAFDRPVEVLHIKMPVSEAIGLAGFAVLKLLGIDGSSILRGESERVVRAYRRADMVVSAPGGPYFGDIYANHELVHWFFVWLAGLFRRPLFLYAPSAGPFRIAWLNPIRRFLFRKFDVLSVREEISEKYLRDLLGPDVAIHVTADSAIQDVVEPMKRGDYFRGSSIAKADRYLVAVSAIDYDFPGESDPAARRADYRAALLACLNRLRTRRDCHFLFIPQLYGRVHSDVPYLRALAGELPEGTSHEIVDGEIDSDAQRRIFGMCDICIATRYHPQIFAASSGVPGLCIYYEHKALGFMSSLGLDDFAFDIRNLPAERMLEKVDEAVDRRDELSRSIQDRMVPLRARSRETTVLAAELYRSRCG